MKKLLKTILCVSLIPFLIGCGNNNHYFSKESKYKEYIAKAGVEGRGRFLIIADGEQCGANFLRADDYNNDGRFDKIQLEFLPKGNPIEKLANLDKLEEIYKEVFNTKDE